MPAAREHKLNLHAITKISEFICESLACSITYYHSVTVNLSICPPMHILQNCELVMTTNGEVIDESMIYLYYRSLCKFHMCIYPIICVYFLNVVYSAKHHLVAAQPTSVYRLPIDVELHHFRSAIV